MKFTKILALTLTIAMCLGVFAACGGNNTQKDNESGDEMTNSWKNDSTGRYYVGEDGNKLTNAWMKDSEGWCYLGENGYCLTNGKYTLDGYEYTFDADGRIQGVPANFSGKTYVAFGDSITWGADKNIGYGQMQNPYPKLVGQTLKFDSVNNQGVSGAFFCKNDLGFKCMTDTILAFNEKADVVSVMLGVNDWSRAMPLGTSSDNTNETIYGCLNLISK